MNVNKKIVVGFSVLMLLFIQFSLLLSPYVVFGNSDGYDLLIVAHEDFLEPLRALADWKTRTGMPTALVSWQEYNRYSSWGWDEPERIKRGIKLAHETYGVKYIMLVGDSDMFPVRYTMTDRISNDSRGENWLGYGAYYASDLYYADLYKQDGSFDNWDSENPNHVYGELYGEYFSNDPINKDGIDMIPDVAVGRIPALTLQEVENYVNKVIDYESRTYGETNVGTTREWFKSALFIIPYTPDDDLDEIFMDAKENIADDHLTSERGFQITRLYDPGISGAASITDGTPTEDMIKWWLNHGVGFVNFGGHGNRDVWDDVFYTWTLESYTLHNSKLPIVLSVGCGTAQFAVQPPYEAYVDAYGGTHIGINNGELWPTPPTLPQPASLQTDIHDSFPEFMLVRHPYKGAIGYVGCVTGAQAWSKYLDEFFFQGYDEGVKLGDMWINMVTEYCDASKSVSGYSLGSIGRGETTIKSGGDWFKVAGYHQPMKFMLFGDPSLRVGGLTNRPPWAQFSLPPEITINEGTTYTFNVADYRFRDLEETPLTYRWDLNGDGDWDTDWASFTTVSHTYTDDRSGEVRFQASDGEYQSSVVTQNITVLNVAPVAYVHTGLPFGTSPLPSYRIGEGKSVRFTLTIHDPGSDTFTYSWNFGEGATPQTSTERHPIVTFEGPEVSPFTVEAVIRTYNVTLTVRDDDGGVAYANLTMEVVHPSLYDRIGGHITVSIIILGSAAIIAAAALRSRLGRKAGRERQRPI